MNVNRSLGRRGFTLLWPARAKRVGVSLQLLGTAMTQGERFHATLVQGFPEGVRVIDAFVNDDNLVWLIVTHPSFDLVAPGDEIPSVSLVFSTSLCENQP